MTQWVREPLDNVLRDLRFAVRGFRRNISVVSVTIAGLALAIAVSTVVISILNAELVRRIGVSDPSSVFQLRKIWTGGWDLDLSHGEFLRLRESARLATLEAYAQRTAVLGEAASENVPVMLVSGGFFEALGGNSALGRVLTAADNGIDGAPVAVMNHAFWNRRFQGDESIIGQTVRLAGTPFTIVGVADEGFTGPTNHRAAPALWAPLALAVDGRVWGSEPAEDLSVQVVGRIPAGSTPESAEAELTALASSLSAERLGAGDPETVRIALENLQQGLTRDAGPVLVTIGIVICLLMLLACANVANLLLAHAVARRREVGTRLALGASRARLVGQLLSESVMLGFLAGVVGLLLALWSLPLVVELLDAPPTYHLVLDARVYSCVTTITLLAGIFAGLAPARYGVRGDLATYLKGDTAIRARGGGPGRARSMLVAGQAMASIVLLIMAALLTRAMIHTARIDLGLDADRLVTIVPRFASAEYDPEGAADYWDRVLERVKTLPGVEEAALADPAPFGLSVKRIPFRHAGGDYTLFGHRVTPEYFATAGIRLVRGRIFTAQEVVEGAPVAVVSESMARLLWGGQVPLGATLEGVLDTRSSAEDLSTTRVVGIVADAVVNRFGIGQPDLLSLYRPLSRAEALLGKLVVRAEGDAAQMVSPLSESIRAIDPRALPTVVPVLDGLDQALQPLRSLATIASLLGTIAIGLASIGVLGVTAYMVQQRSKEVSVRLALGADAGDVVRLMFRESLKPVAGGVAAGLLVALVGTRVLNSYLYGIDEHDPLSILAAAALLFGIAAIATWVPVRRAALVDPARILRQD